MPRRARRGQASTSETPSDSQHSTQTDQTLRFILPRNTTATTPVATGHNTSRTESSGATDQNIDLQLLNQSSITPDVPATLRQKVNQAIIHPSPRKRKEVSKKKTIQGEEENSDNKDEIHRRLIHATRWHTFLYFTPYIWTDIVEQCYGSGYDTDSATIQGARSNILGNVRAWKCRVIENMTKDHVREFTDSPEHKQTLGLYRSRNLLADFFQKVFTPSNFFSVWRYMKGYVSYESSSELGQYFMRSIYVNLAVETKLYVDAANEGSGEKDLREKLMKFYNCIPTAAEFAEVDKADFKELNQCFSNRHTSNMAVMEECYVSLGPPPKKQRPQTRY